MRRTVLWSSAAAVTAVLAGGGLATYEAMDKTVTLSVDGQDRRVQGAGTVGEVLREAKVRVGEHDIVAPAVDEKVADGDRVTVRYARPLRLTVDGATRTVWTTARSVQEALAMTGVRADGAYLSASRSRPLGRDGLALSVRLPRRVTVVTAGTRRTVVTTAATVREALRSAGVTPRATDTVSAALTARPTAGQVITVRRIDRKRVVTKSRVGFDTVRKETRDLREGRMRVERAGRPGTRTTTYAETWTDGRRTTRRLVSRTVTVRPVDRVLLVGTRPAPVVEPVQSRSERSSSRVQTRVQSPVQPRSQRSSGGGGGGKAPGGSWGALARCESGGNPRAVNPSGRYYGLYQFSPSTWRSVGGSGLPSSASAAEQTRRAKILYGRAGRSSWPVCGRHL